MSERTMVFTDGAAKGNPGPGGWGAVIAYGDGRVEELGGRESLTTNNRMELAAAIEALRRLSADVRPVDLYTDSSYVARGITEWVAGWRRSGWRTKAGGDVANRDQWEELWDLVAGRAAGAKVRWHRVRGHAGVAGNERADAIASDFALGESVDLFSGSAADYPIDLAAPVTLAGAGDRARGRAAGKDAAGPAQSAQSRSRRGGGAAYSYLSLVGGELARHATWAECERRVKGRSGARYRKAMSAAEEAAILSAWGISPHDS